MTDLEACQSECERLARKVRGLDARAVHAEAGREALLLLVRRIAAGQAGQAEALGAEAAYLEGGLLEWTKRSS